MAAVIGALLAIACLTVVILPFRRRVNDPVPATDPGEELPRAREALYQDVRVLRQDLDLGHLTHGEYQERVQDNRVRAAALLQRQERLEALSQRLEEEIAALRQESDIAAGEEA